MKSKNNHKGILGIHHITAIAGNPQKNIDFYTGFLGLRLVKLTVNFDDPTTYHFYYGDNIGRPGTILTFFPWYTMPKGFRGTGQVITTSFSIPEHAIEYWLNRLKSHEISYAGPIKRFDDGEDNEQVITLYDPDGMEIELVAHKIAEERKEYVWRKGPVPEEYATRGFYSATLSLEGYERTADLLTENMGFSNTKKEGNRFRFEIKDKEKMIDNFYSNKEKRKLDLLNSPSSVDLICLPDTRRGYMGLGSVHHIAWRTPNDESQLDLRKRIVNTGLNATPVIDRRYFHSVYFREPGGILFEIATDPPGFLVDQNEDELGQKLLLPQWLEPDRKYLEQVLPKINIPSLDKFTNYSSSNQTDKGLTEREKRK
ncbi:ring-cleaving dioxygenase [Candidatus Nitrosocosmicus franklandus]|uniref:Putative ring-cleaving dioxygenase MhqO n=1 Tax=Candidatus Nitrosocosmicus franklandianus TaxID=1798806 RepID=A0A484IBD1_9ARCH|nr:ring-cleaving dioxygenase [Candidatus Nitrosocosmicus franklandus]VFJ14388.1 putative ring-cleaving dioxygenase MhqO [Candidatus Nitrosocosmicus franklandus]